MKRSVLAFTLLCPGLSAQEGVARLARDPDRGLEAELRKRLTEVEPAADAWPVETWAAEMEGRLGELARAWEEGRAGELARAPWIRSELRVAPLFAEPAPAAPVARGPWSVARATRAPEAAAELELAAALSAWRASFGDDARLELAVLAIDDHAAELRARVALDACGARGEARLQHNAEWTCAWRIVPPATAGARATLELTGLALESFVAVALAGRGLFEDVTAAAFEEERVFREEVAPGLDDWRRGLASSLEPGTLGHHGLAVADVDGDGLEDVYWCRPGGLPNKLFLHTSEHLLRDASAAAGVDLLDYSSSALLVDLEKDGDADLVVATGSGLALFANDGRGRFEPRLHLGRALSTSLAAADYDGDGDLDLYACAYVSPFEKSGLPVPYHAAENGAANALYRNDGAWRFSDETVSTGLDANNRRFSLAAAWEDYDNDGDPDLYVANDFGANNLYRNDGGRFRDVAEEQGALDVAAGMGVAWGDVDDDGWPDLYVTNMHSAAGCRLTARSGFRPGSDAATRRAYRHHAQGNTLLLNERGRAWRDASETSGTARGGWGWGALFLDLDLDGRLDLYAPNGFVSGARRDDLGSYFWRQVVLRSPDGPGEPGEVYPRGWRAVNRLVRQGFSWNGHERDAAFLNLGQGQFAAVAGAAGLDLADDGRAAARVDWDGDGDEDLITTQRTGPMLRVLLHSGAPPSWIAFALRGAEQRSPVGARIELETSDGRRLHRGLACGEGYLAQSSARVHFGLGSDGVRGVRVRWPGGASEDFGAPAPGALHVLEQGTGRAVAVAPPAPAERLRPSASSPALTGPAADEGARTVLSEPLPLPRLALETWDERPASVLGIGMQGSRGTGQPLCLVLWSSAAPACRPALEGLALGAELLHGSGLQVLALCADAGPERATARALLDEIAWPHGRGFAGEEALQILELALGALHDDARSLALPSAFLIDPAGRLVATYEGRLSAERLRRDVELVALAPDARLAAATPFAGRWVKPPVGAEAGAEAGGATHPGGELADTLATRLAAHGLERPAAEYRVADVQVRQLSAPRLSYERGVAAHKGGRLAEAIAHYRDALAIDPGSVFAARDLAVALHQQGDRDAARRAYEAALVLDPGHALTRCNLGYVCLDLGDLEGAKRELAALRALKSELADELERRIQKREKREGR